MFMQHIVILHSNLENDVKLESNFKNQARLLARYKKIQLCTYFLISSQAAFPPHSTIIYIQVQSSTVLHDRQYNMPHEARSEASIAKIAKNLTAEAGLPTFNDTSSKKQINDALDQICKILKTKKDTIPANPISTSIPSSMPSESLFALMTYTKRSRPKTMTLWFSKRACMTFCDGVRIGKRKIERHHMPTYVICTIVSLGVIRKFIESSCNSETKRLETGVSGAHPTRVCTLLKCWIATGRDWCPSKDV